MIACAACGRQCVPMADYDSPTCLHCDADIDAIRRHVERRDFVDTPPARLAPLFDELRRQVAGAAA